MKIEPITVTTLNKYIKDKIARRWVFKQCPD